MANEIPSNAESFGVDFVNNTGDFLISIDSTNEKESNINILWTYSNVPVKRSVISTNERTNWSGLPESFYSGVDAALWNKDCGKIYFFKGGEFLRVNPRNGWKMDEGYPKPICGNWPGLDPNFATGIDAAIWIQTSNKVYLFKGDKYVLLNPGNGWNMEPGYPKPIAGNWPGMPDDFAQGIDTAFWSTKNNKIYIFKGSQYVRIDPAYGWSVDAGYPKPIAGNWPGLADKYTEGIDAALLSENNGKVYFFKNNLIEANYVRIDPNNEWKMDSGYPKSIADK